VDCVADDMTRAGTQVDSDLKPDRIDAVHDRWDDLFIWNRLNATLKWSRLYGGAVAVIVIDGQRMSDPLRVETIGRGQFKGLLVFDRWQLYPHLEDLVSDPSDGDFGLPRYYEIVADARSLPSWKIHHSRCIRFDGIEQPFFQQQAENYWGISILEPAWDRLLAFDSVTAGAAQLVFKAHLRVIKIKQLRQLIARNDGTTTAVYAQLEMIRQTQASEGLTILDADDDFAVNQYAFGGLSDVMIQFAQQLSGAADIPLTRLFGQSPAGLSATGESDLRNYYDSVNSQQRARLLRPVRLLYDLVYRTRYGEPLPDGFGVTFTPLWQLAETEKSSIAGTVTSAVGAALQDGVIDVPTAMRELRQSSRVTGVFSNITDEAIEEAVNRPPPAPPGPDGQPIGPDGQPLEPGAEGGAADPGTGTPGGAPTGPDGQPLGPETASGGDPGATDPGAAPAAPRDPQVVPGGAQPPTAPDPNEADDSAPDGAVSGVTGEPARDPDPGSTWVEVLEDGKRWVHVTKDGSTYPLRDVHGLDVVIETPRGTKRVGYGWSVLMPADYGYIRGTSSAEGPREQLDCFVGPETDSELVWVIDQLDPDLRTFDEHKVMLDFGSEEEALDAYKAAFSDGRGAERIGNVRRMHVDVLKRWLAEEWPYGKGEPKVRAGA